MNKERSKILLLALFCTFGLITSKLFYWQILKGPELREKALNQTFKLEKLEPQRGKIYTSDNYPLALNQTYYQISIYKPNLKENIEEVLNKINNIVPSFKQDNQTTIENFISNSNQKWITFPNHIAQDQKNNLNISGLDFSKFEKRFYPESGLAQNIIGSNIYGGLESYYNKQLKGKTGFVWSSKDATGKTILNKKSWMSEAVDGRNLHTTINRSIQFLVENALIDGIEKYSADSGSIAIMNPKTGNILALASLTATSSATPSARKNSAISDLFEPGSIFKPIVMTMAFDAKAIDLNYICTKCDSPKKIGQYSITNWDSELHPNSTVYDIIKNSDNIGMSYIIERLGLSNFLNYYNKLGLSQKTGIDLQGEAKPLIKNEWPDIDFATASFGQGVAVTQINMLQAFNTIANDGILVHPHILNYFDENGKLIKYKSRPEIKVFETESVKSMKSVLKFGVENGTVARFKPENMEVCAKSGTAQIAIGGTYTNSSTIASYIGFSPCENPKFTMIVTINNPRTSPWGSSTAAPIWYDLADSINHLL